MTKKEEDKAVKDMIKLMKKTDPFCYCQKCPQYKGKYSETHEITDDTQIDELYCKKCLKGVLKYVEGFKQEASLRRKCDHFLQYKQHKKYYKINPY